MTNSIKYGFPTNIIAPISNIHGLFISYLKNSIIVKDCDLAKG